VHGTVAVRGDLAEHVDAQPQQRPTLNVVELAGHLHDAVAFDDRIRAFGGRYCRRRQRLGREPHPGLGSDPRHLLLGHQATKQHHAALRALAQPVQHRCQHGEQRAAGGAQES